MYILGTLRKAKKQNNCKKKINEKKTYKINFYLPNENIEQNTLNEINSRFDDETHRKNKQKKLKKNC